MDSDEVLGLMQATAAELINPRFRALAAGEVHEKNPGDLVTIADHEAEEAITAALRAAYPRAVILGEEAFSRDPELLTAFAHAEHAFTVDPVDGTKNFVNGSPDHAVMLGEVVGGTVTRAWIWQPQHERGFVAERGAGAWLLAGGSRERLTCAPPSEETESWRGITSRWSWVGRELPGLAPLELTWVCCGVDYPHLIAGDADFAVYRRVSPWDHVPGSLLVEESGGALGSFGGQPFTPLLDHDLIVATSAEVLAHVQHAVASA